VTPAEALRSGLVVLLPTDTVYGLAVDPTVPGATERLFALKGRRRDVPIAVLVADAEQALAIADPLLPESARSLVERHWPGALTVVVRRHPGWTADIGDSRGTVGLRCPDDEFLRDLCREVGPLATTSANRHGEPTLPTAAEVVATLPYVDLVVDRGPRNEPPSTVVDCTVDPPRVLRQGAVAI
jgi:L-threonylcarbamoyladenylate synthase